MAGKTKANEINIIRYYDAPVTTVWEAWTDPAQAAHWWGPRGFTITTHGKDLRPGGYWSYTMHGPDGVDYPNKTIYLEVEKNARLVYDHGGNDDRPPLFRVTVLFSEEAGRTKMDMTMALPSEEAAKQTHQFIKKAGGYSTWDRLAEYLDKNEAFIISRSFDAPIETVFSMWTDPAHFSQWLAPAGSDMTFMEADIRTGGKSFFRMSNEMYTLHARASYVKIEKPHTIIYTQQFCDKDGNVSRHPMAPVWPETMLTQVNFEALDADKTLVTVKWEAHGRARQEEVKAFLEARPGMTLGWTGSFDKLEQMLADRSKAISAA